MGRIWDTIPSTAYPSERREASPKEKVRFLGGHNFLSELASGPSDLARVSLGPSPNQIFGIFRHILAYCYSGIFWYNYGIILQIILDNVSMAHAPRYGKCLRQQYRSFSFWRGFLSFFFFVRLGQP